MPDQEPRSLDVRRKQAIYRANHRGIKEMDLILGGFAVREVPSMSEEMLDQFEALLAVPDQELFAWVLGTKTPPPEMSHVGQMLNAVSIDASGGKKTT